MKHRSFDILGNVAVVNFQGSNRIPTYSRPRSKSGTKEFREIARPPRRNNSEIKDIFSAKFQKKILLQDKKKFAREILRKNNSVKTVLEKTGKVKGRLRKIQTKYLAGEKTKEVLYKENGCVFRFNIDTCYFSPRLSNERKEIASRIKAKENVFVMFAGVAPFPIVIAKNSHAKKVFSNEINREANKYATLNIELNHVKDKVVLLQGDIEKVVRNILSKSASNCSHPPAQKILSLSVPKKFNVIVMPRPNLKETFLKEAFALSKKGTRIYYYDFCNVDEVQGVVEKIKSEAKKFRKKIRIMKIKSAGNIAPYKIRVRVDFKIL